MKTPLGWLNEYVDIDVDVDVTALSDALTLSGTKVESFEELGEGITNVVIGKIVKLEKHPDADSLQVAQVDIGKEETIQLITRATNVFEGAIIPVALVGANLAGDLKIKKGNLRGLPSEGMMCSINEINITKEQYPDADEDGIFILDDSFVIGMDAKEALGLDEIILDYEITPNRGDCLSMLGIAREAAATIEKDFTPPVIEVKEENGRNAKEFIDVDIEATDLCHRYIARVVTDVEIGPSPKWMRERLHAAGVRPLNNIVDITNYVMLEYGQPMHAFDIRDINDSRIIVRKARKGEKITTLDEQERELQEGSLVISDNTRAIAVAGVMGGLNSEVKDDTTTVVFESACFDGASVRSTGQKIGIRSESSMRFEKGIDAERCFDAVNRAVQLVEMLGIGKVCKGMVDNYPVKEVQKTIKFDCDKINKFLGTDLDKQYMIDVLNRVEIVVDDNDIATVPYFRNDVEILADLAEEVARFYDYNNIEATLPKSNSTELATKTYEQIVEDKITDTLISFGLSETYTFSFTSPKVFDMLGIGEDSELRNTVKILNPLGEDYSIMRTTTVPEMLKLIAYNYNRQIPEGDFFESARIYLPTGGELPEERKMITIGCYGDDNVDFFHLKGIVEDLFDVLKVKRYKFRPVTDVDGFHPGRTANITIANEYVGTIGEIAPFAIDKFGAPKRVYICTLETAKIIKASSLDISYKQLPKFPATVRDLAIVVNENILVGDLEDTIKAKGSNLLESVTLFDIFRGKQILEGKKSVAFSLSFRNNDKTITEEEVNVVMDKIQKELNNKFEAEIRS